MKNILFLWEKRKYSVFEFEFFSRGQAVQVMQTWACDLSLFLSTCVAGKAERCVLLFQINYEPMFD